jgi:hypothetical protein
MPWFFYKEMSDPDLAAVFAYLQSVPHVVHEVSNVDKPEYCKKCWNIHGRGKLN